MGACSSSAKNWGWAVTRRRCLKVQLSPCKGPPWMRSKLQGVPHCRFVLRRSQLDSGESCIVLQSWQTRRLITKFPQRSVVACSMQISCCRERTLRTRPRKGVCEPLMHDVVASKAQLQLIMRAKRTYLQIQYARIYHGGQLHGEPRKTTKPSKLLDACSGMGACLGQYGRCVCLEPGVYVVWYLQISKGTEVTLTTYNTVSFPDHIFCAYPVATSKNSVLSKCRCWLHYQSLIV